METIDENRIQLKLNNNPKATGFIHDLSYTQYETLQKFKERLIKEKVLLDFTYFDDVYLLRFLRARKFDLDKSFLMINNFFQWRKKENVDEAINFVYDEIGEIKKLYPHTYHKTDKIVKVYNNYL